MWKSGKVNKPLLAVYVTNISSSIFLIDTLKDTWLSYKKKILTKIITEVKKKVLYSLNINLLKYLLSFLIMKNL